MIEWPDILKPRTVTFALKGRAVSGGAALEGRDQRVASDAGFWAADLAQFPIVTRDKARAWRSTIAKMDGGVETVEIPVMDCKYKLSATLDGVEVVNNGQPHSDGTYFTDGTGYDEPDEVVLPFRLTANAALRATTISVELDDEEIVVGMAEGIYFSIGTRLYLVTGVEETAANQWDITFRPPLRSAAATGAHIDFLSPSIEMRIADPNAGELPLDLLRFAFPSLSFIEAI
jgi:hypothetical protein